MVEDLKVCRSINRNFISKRFAHCTALVLYRLLISDYLMEVILLTEELKCLKFGATFANKEAIPGYQRLIFRRRVFFLRFEKCTHCP